jgi:hypothetical protein
MSENTPANKPTRVNVKVVADNAAKPVTLVLTGNRGMCSCGWIGHPRWLAYWAKIDAQIHHEETGHGLAEPLVWGDVR